MKPLPPDQWDPSLRHVIDDMDGKPINAHALMANHPYLLNAWWNYRNYAVSGGELAQRECELLILRVAVHMQAWYEWGSHVDRGLIAGLSIEEIKRVLTDPKSSDWSNSDGLLLEAVDQLIENRAINGATLTELSGHFSPQQILDIVAIHGMYVTLGCMINTWNLPLDDSVRKRLPAGITQAAFEQLISTSHGD